jgi:hypothetical protein
MRKTNQDSKKFYKHFQALICKRGRRRDLLWERENILKRPYLISKRNPIRSFAWM